MAATTRTSTLRAAVRAHGAHLAVLQHAQQLRLELGRHVADLVEEQRAAVGLHEEAPARRGGAGEGALHVAEQLALQQRRGAARCS